MDKKELINLLRELLTVEVEFSRCGDEVTVSVAISVDGDEVCSEWASEHFDFKD